jgi:hypothetical protein
MTDVIPPKLPPSITTTHTSRGLTVPHVTAGGDPLLRRADVAEGPPQRDVVALVSRPSVRELDVRGGRGGRCPDAGHGMDG